MFFLCYPSYVFFSYVFILLVIVPGRLSNHLVYLHFILLCEFEIMFSFLIKMLQLQMFLFFRFIEKIIKSIIKIIVSCSPSINIADKLNPRAITKSVSGLSSNDSYSFLSIDYKNESLTPTHLTGIRLCRLTQTYFTESSPVLGLLSS